MIQKDIVYEKNDIDEKGINDIFENADNEMIKMENAMLVKEKKKKRMNPLKATLLLALIFTIIFIFIVGFLFVKETTNSYSAFKESIKDSITEQIDNVLEKEDSELTTDEYYQKQIFSLIPEGEIEKTIDNLDEKDLLTMDSEKLVKLITGLIPEDKYEECKKIFEEYEKAKALEIESFETDQKGNLEQIEKQE